MSGARGATTNSKLTLLLPAKGSAEELA